MRVAPFLLSAEHVRQLGGASPLHNLIEVKYSEAQGRSHEAESEGNVEQRYGLMDKNRI